MRSKTTRVWIGAIALVGLLTAACTAGTPAPGPGDEAKPGAGAIKRGNVFSNFQTSTWSGADPHMGTNSFYAWPYIGEYILRIGLEDFQIKPSIVESWEWSSDGLTLTLKVRQGIKFHNKPPINGREVEARDVVYTINSILGAQYPDLPAVRFPRRGNLDGMLKAEVVDKHTVKVTMARKTSTFLAGLAEYRSPLIPDGLREHFGADLNGLQAPDPARYISAGPFILKSLENDVEAVYEANPDYWDKGVDGKPKPYLAGIRETWIRDVSAQDAAFLSGKIDLLASPDRDRFRLITSQKRDAQVLLYKPSSCWNHFRFNLTRKPYDDLRVRKAMGLAIDPTDIGTTLVGKEVFRFGGALPYVYPEAISQETLAKLPGNRLPKDQDIAEARKLMAEAGYPNGFTTEFVVWSAPHRLAIAQIVKDQIEKALPGMQINLKVFGDLPATIKAQGDGNFDLGEYCFIHEPTAAAFMYTAYHTKGGRNYGRISDPQLDRLIEQAGEELDDTKRAQILREAQQRAAELWVIVPTYHNLGRALVQPYVRDFPMGPATSWQGLMAEVWLDK